VKIKRILLFIIMISMLSCATVHKGRYARQVVEPYNTLKKEKITEGGLVVSGRLERALSNDYYKFIGFTFENRSGNKVSISNVSVDFNNAALNSLITVISGEEILGWHDAMDQEKKRREFNRSTFFTSLFLGGSLLAVFGDDNWSDVGLGMVLGGITSLTIDEFNRERKEIQTGKIFPETHLLSGKFDIMPGFYQNKWLVINIKNPNNMPERIYVEYSVDGVTERVALPL